MSSSFFFLAVNYLQRVNNNVAVGGVRAEIVAATASPTIDELPRKERKENATKGKCSDHRGLLRSGSRNSQGIGREWEMECGDGLL